MAQTYQLHFANKRHLTSDIWQFNFEKPDGFSFTPGQYMQYHLPHASSDDRGEKRWFTISSSPTEQFITITTRIFELMSSFKHALNQLPTGQAVEANGPEGDFILPDTDQAAVLIAGGIGVTPYHSMVKQLLDTDTERPLTLLYGAKKPADLVYHDDFAAAAARWPSFKLIEVVDTPDDNWNGPTGMISDEQISTAAGAYDQPAVFVSGPEPMVDAFKPRLQKIGFSEEQIKQDWFPNYVDRF